MIKRLATETPPKSGFYFCEIDQERMHRFYIVKDVLWYSIEEKKWLTESTPDIVVAWYDDGEEDQDILWSEVKELVWKASLHAYLSAEAIEQIKRAGYIISRK